MPGKRMTRKNKLKRIAFITVTVFIAIGLVIPLASLFQAQPVVSDGQAAMRQQLSALEAQAKANPSDAAVLRELAGMYLKLEMYVQAATVYEQVLALEPGDVASRYDLSVAYYYSDAYDQAIEHLAWLLEDEPSSGRAQIMYGYVLGFGKKDYVAAIQSLQNYIDTAQEGTDSDIEAANSYVEAAKEAVTILQMLAEQEIAEQEATEQEAADQEAAGQESE